MKRTVATYSRKETALPILTLRFLDYCLARFYHRVKVRSPCTLPAKGPAILVCNHLSSLDPVLIQSASGRLIRWMCAREYYEQRGLKWLLDIVGTIPVSRNQRDMAATRAALEALEAGYVLGIFPEGKFETSNELLPFQPGPIFLSIKSGAAIYPAHLEGTQRGKDMLGAYLVPRRASLSFGPALTLTRQEVEKSGFDQATAQMQAAVEKLRQEELAIRKIQGPMPITQQINDTRS
jgi:1-acyl-sn-glycerol-3-phosphate acyltransferase